MDLALAAADNRHLLISRKNNEIAGFLVLGKKQESWFIELLKVADTIKVLESARRLSTRRQTGFIQRETQIQVVTPADNQRALASYERSRFERIHRETVLHISEILIR